ncbi:polyprenyl synthetase family protein [Campylobacter novaezeelandiae]|uniref:Polyprenyl synthetase family protein n=1 Tax=Campylobacter novaezeelandiae TaxID=2267891 RepID=A0A4Q9JTY9_9BACT|nr:polyprenyl synthetase family protein [Campylobacter novaezeelandiae]QWU80278.1 octaprenyl-diphosphate synthase [Campylobacter novaezeelandiae]TBR80026.1 polyprenyl synthetase family protein [Campylobacter novaezeelandiae]TBR81071.1 polyprenyl synthetase family protein [Campylobacter novaezeelandiae]
MQEIDTLIQNYLKDLDYTPVLKMLDSINIGKKLRSKLLLNIAGKSDISFKLCAIIELIHLASLLHDDIIDDAKLRRGARSINDKFGAKNALMLGDILYSKAFFELSKMDANFAQIISDAVVKLSLGELMDINLSQEFNIDEDKYLKMIYHKTAVLIEASAKCGAILAGLSEGNFANYGKNLGLAFQIVDDILDIKSNESILGKPIMSDFKEGKTTLPYIYLYKKLDNADKNILVSFFKKELDKNEILWIKEQMIEKQILEEVFNKAKTYGNNALIAIESYNNASLNEIIDNMISREF